MAEKVSDIIAANPTLADRAVGYLGHEMLIEQANRERIVEHAVEDLRSDPPGEDPGREIEDDWLHTFMKEASTKSAPEMQVLFGKILSGEISSPGTFSLKAVRTLSMMSMKTLRHFKTLCNLSASFEGRALVISYWGNASQNSLVMHGLYFALLNELNENDLVHSDYNISYSWKPFAEGRIPFSYASETVWLQTKDANKLDFLSKVRGVVFTTVGRELRRIISMQPDPSYTRELIKYFEARGCELFKSTSKREDGALVGRPYRDLI
jgi:hypothetical protein